MENATTFKKVVFVSYCKNDFPDLWTLFIKNSKKKGCCFFKNFKTFEERYNKMLQNGGNWKKIGKIRRKIIIMFPKIFLVIVSYIAYVVYATKLPETWSLSQSLKNAWKHNQVIYESSERTPRIIINLVNKLIRHFSKFQHEYWQS